MRMLRSEKFCRNQRSSILSIRRKKEWEIKWPDEPEDDTRKLNQGTDVKHSKKILTRTNKMSRRSKKQYERIHTERAKNHFPPVSPVILHKDGSIEKQSFITARIKTGEWLPPTPFTFTKTESPHLNLSRKIQILLTRIKSWFKTVRRFWQ